jgi:hypothetical protein
MDYLVGMIEFHTISGDKHVFFRVREGMIELYEKLAEVDRKYANQLIDKHVLCSPAFYLTNVNPEKLAEWLSPNEIEELDSALSERERV